MTSPACFRRYLLATAGHVDHGKSALVRALTGAKTDRLPEEKKRGITIDLGFASFDLPGFGLCLGVVDVPGHEDFIKNMVAGVGAVDVALLAVAADDGWMPQTEEHARILEYLGVTRAVVALTKNDLLPDDDARAAALATIRARLAGRVFAAAPIIPTSLPSGDGLNELRAALARVLKDAPPPADFGKPRLPIDRVFTLRGVGTVVTGSLTGGALGRGQTVIVQPGGRTARVRSIQCHGRDVERALPGSRAALCLPDLPADPDAPGAPRRGDVATLETLGAPALALDALLVRLPARDGFPEPPLKDGAEVRVHLGSGHAAARVRLLEDGPLRPGGRMLARVRFASPVYAFAGDRFVVRDASGRHTLAGGLALDPDPPKHGRHGARRRAWLERLAEAPGEAAAHVAARLARDGFAARGALAVKSRFSAEEIRAALETLATAGQAFLTEPLAADGAWWADLRARAAALIDDCHRAQPELPGLSVARLKAQLPKSAAGAFEALTGDLAAPGGEFTSSAGCIRRAGRRPALPPHLQAAGDQVRAALLGNPAEPPSRAALAPGPAAQAALRFLLETGEAVELSPEIVLLAGVFARLRAAVVRRLRAGGPATVSELRQMLGGTRRVVVPLLERLDRDGVTRREGDRRVLGKGQPA